MKKFKWDNKKPEPSCPVRDKHLKGMRTGYRCGFEIAGTVKICPVLYRLTQGL